MAQTQSSLYDVLLVGQNATLDEIKLAFKRRALQVHPDKGGSKEEFHLVYQALETLADPAARKKYDHGLATQTGLSSSPKGKKRKRAGQNAPSCKAETFKTKPQTPGKKSTNFIGKARTGRATPAEPQSKQTKLLMKIRDLLKQLPRDARNDVITNQFSQKQRLILERFMADNADTASGTQVHCEAKALATAAGKSATDRMGDPSHEISVALPATNVTNSFEVMAKSMEKKRKSTERSSCDAICISPRQVSTSRMQPSDRKSLPCAVKEMKPGNALARPQMDMAKAKPPRGMARNKKTKYNTKARNSGYVRRGNKDSTSYNAGICFDSLEMSARNCDLKTALEDLVILTAVKQKMRNRIGTGTFTERLQAALVSSSAEHGRNLPGLKLGFLVKLHAGCFIGSSLRTPSVRSMDVFGKIRSVLEQFRKYSKHMGSRSVYWQYGPLDLEDAWIQFQSAVAEAWEMAGVDSTATLQKIRSLYKAQDQFRGASLQRWEQQHMARQDKNGHRPRHLRKKNPTGLLEYWERHRMGMQDKDKHRPKKLRPKLQLRKFPSESRVSRQLTALRKLIARWGQMLKREAKLVDKERRKVIKQRKAQQKKDQEEQRRVEALKQKRQREEERSRRELLRKKMRSDLTMDDILGQKRCPAGSR